MGSAVESVYRQILGNFISTTKHEDIINSVDLIILLHLKHNFQNYRFAS